MPMRMSRSVCRIRAHPEDYRHVPTPEMTVGPLTDADLPAVVDLITTQETRRHSGDPRLERPHG